MHLFKNIIVITTMFMFVSGCLGYDKVFESAKENDWGNNSGMIEFYLTDSPGAEFIDAMYVTFEEIEVYKIFESSYKEENSGEIGEWISIPANKEKINLLELNNGKLAELGSSSLEPAVYAQIRIAISSASIVVLDQEIMLEIPSDRMKFIMPFIIEPYETIEMIADFNAMNSVEQMGNGTYIMSPAIRLVERSKTGAVSGTLAVMTNAQLTVSSIEHGEKKVYSGTVPEEDGTFKLAYMEPGNYDLVIEQAGCLLAKIDNIEVVTGQVVTITDPINISDSDCIRK